MTAPAKLNRQQSAMIVFLSVHGPQPWIEVTAISGVLGDGFIRQVAGVTDRKSIAALDDLVARGFVQASKPSGLRYRLTASGRKLIDDSLRRAATPSAHQEELALDLFAVGFGLVAEGRRRPRR